jgi:hypothetical protein
MMSLNVSSAFQEAVTYRLEAPTVVDRLTDWQIELLEKLNRTDREYLRRLERVIVPDGWDADELDRSPLPAYILELKAHEKGIVVHLPMQVFGAYEFGQLIGWGPISSGRAQHPTPPGLYYLNWRSQERTSSDNSSWHMNWYFNFHNVRGLAFHQFALPGRPASHACIRLLRRDAEWLYEWGEDWMLSPDGREVLRPGTPVWIIGAYDFSRRVPWMNPDSWNEHVSLPQGAFGIPGS